MFMLLLWIPMDSLLMDSQCLLSCHDSTTEVTSVSEGAWEVNTLHMVPDISPTSTSLIAHATKPTTSLVSHHKFVKIFRGVEVTLNKTRLNLKTLLFSILMKSFIFINSYDYVVSCDYLMHVWCQGPLDIADRGRKKYWGNVGPRCDSEDYSFSCCCAGKYRTQRCRHSGVT